MVCFSRAEVLRAAADALEAEQKALADATFLSLPALAV